ncbi:MAG: SPW repeat protein [bacterium]|nr:SPW repeat protein [bacterium]
MWKHWVNGVLGLWVIIMPYLGFTATAHQILMVVAGIVIAVLSFWAASDGRKGMPMQS